MTSAMLPKVKPTKFTELQGVAAVASVLAEIGLVWRETNAVDVGIDGQIEHVDEKSFATGRLVAAQIKTGPSYFAKERADAWLYTPEVKHRTYWERYPLPVLLILHDPDTKRSYWADVRQQLRGESPPSALIVPKSQILQSSTADELFATTGVDHGQFLESLDDVFLALIKARNPNAGFAVSHFDLFVHGLTNIARSIYFGMDVPMMIAEHKLAETGSEFGVGVGRVEQEFLFAFVRFLVAQNLARIDFGDILVDWIDREMQPHFVAPLTSRGRELVRLIQRIEGRMVEKGALPDQGHVHVAQEAFFQMVPYSFSSRLPRIQAFQEKIDAFLSADQQADG